MGYSDIFHILLPKQVHLDGQSANYMPLTTRLRPACLALYIS